MTLLPRILASALLLAGPLALAQTPTTQLRLWNGAAPGVPENPGPEKQEAQGRVSNVSEPTLDVYLPEPGKANGVAIIMCSGGAYTRLASGPQGQGAAAAFLPLGYTVFSLKYRLAPPSKDVLKDALADAQRAVRIVRSRAAEWHLQPNRIGLTGFSAGSNLILNLATHFDAGNPSSPDPVERQSCRPDFIGLCCPWPYKQKVADFTITRATPPAFIVHAVDDKSAPITFAEQLAAAWKAAGVPVTFEAYPTGGHMGFNFPTPVNPDWTGKFAAWIQLQKPAK